VDGCIRHHLHGDDTRLVFAALVGYALFSDVPNTVTMLGAGIVIASTLYLSLREARLGVPQAASV
jgi:drug/metabolite transporter (DMT)-like permease